MAKLTEDQKALGDKALFGALIDARREFGELWPVASVAMGLPVNAIHSPAYRFTDAWLQRNRKAGNISFVRVGRQSLWSLTDAGLALTGKES